MWLRRNADLIQDATFLDVPARLARVLLDLAGEPGSVIFPRAGAVIPDRMKQGELAALVGATRESINKWLGSFERQGLIASTKARSPCCGPASSSASTDQLRGGRGRSRTDDLMYVEHGFQPTELRALKGPEVYSPIPSPPHRMREHTCYGDSCLHRLRQQGEWRRIGGSGPLEAERSGTHFADSLG